MLKSNTVFTAAIGEHAITFRGHLKAYLFKLAYYRSFLAHPSNC